jgi:subtilisin family serine protease
MKRLFFITISIILLSSTTAGAGWVTVDTKSISGVPNFVVYVPDRIVVKFDPSFVLRIDKRLLPHGKTGIDAVDEVGSRHGAASVQRQFPNAKKKVFRGKTIDLSGWHEITFSGEVDVNTVVAQYKAIPGVIDAQAIGIHPIFSEPAPLQPNDPSYSSQWHLSRIQAPVAWNIEAGNPAVIVAVLDTGVRYFQKDLGGSNASYSNPTAINGNMWINWAEYNGTSGVDDDGNGYKDDWVGWDFVKSSTGGILYPCYSGEDCSTEDNDPRDFNGHGTHCACIVAAINNNGNAVCSVAGGWGNGTLEPTGNGVKIMALRIGWSAKYIVNQTEYGFVDMSYAAKALHYAADNGAKIASCSWGSSNSGGIQEAVEYFLASGGLIFIAAGNDGADSPDYISTLSYDGIINVAATDQNDCKASFSNYGTWVDIAAPGVSILSCYHDHTDATVDHVATLSGTSMATPMAAGTAALIWSQIPSLTASQVRAQLLGSADNIDGLACNSSYAGKLGAGRINAYNAVSSIAAMSGDFAPSDCDVDGSDLAALIANPAQLDLTTFAGNFGRNACQ